MSEFDLIFIFSSRLGIGLEAQLEAQYLGRVYVMRYHRNTHTVFFFTSGHGWKRLWEECGMPVSAVRTINFSCGLGPFLQALCPLLATSVLLNLLLEQLIQRALRGTAVLQLQCYLKMNLYNSIQCVSCKLRRKIVSFFVFL